MGPRPVSSFGLLWLLTAGSPGCDRPPLRIAGHAALAPPSPAASEITLEGDVERNALAITREGGLRQAEPRARRHLAETLRRLATRTGKRGGEARARLLQTLAHRVAPQAPPTRDATAMDALRHLLPGALTPRLVSALPGERSRILRDRQGRVELWITPAAGWRSRLTLFDHRRGQVQWSWTVPRISRAAVTAVGGLVAVATEGGVHLRNLATGRYRAQLSLRRWGSPIVTRLRFDPAGKQVAVGTENGWLHLWSLRGQKVILRVRLTEEWDDDAPQVETLDFDAGRGRLRATTSHFGARRRQWTFRTKDGRFLNRRRVPPAEPTPLFERARLRTLLHNTALATVLAPIQGVTGPARLFAIARAHFDAQGWLTVVDTDGELIFWAPDTGAPRGVRFARPDGAPALPVHPSGRFLVTTDSKQRVHLHALPGGARVLTLVHFGASDWLVTTPDGYVDGTPAARQRLAWRTGPRLPATAGWSTRRIPRLLARILAGDTSFRLAGLRRLVWPDSGAPPRTPLTAKAFLPDGPAPSWSTLYALGAEEGWRNLRAWFHRTSLGGQRWVAVIEGHVGVGFELGFKLMGVEHRDGSWYRRWSVRLPLSARGEYVPFKDEKRRSGAWTSVGDLDADGRPEVRVRYSYPVHPTRKIGPTRIIDEAVVNVDGDAASLAFHGQVHETIPRADGEPLKAYGKLAFEDRDADGHPDIVLIRTRPVEVWRHQRAWTKWQRSRQVYRYHRHQDRWLVDAYAR